MIHLSHPQHGQKIAYLEAEAVADEKNGWVRASKEEPKLVVRILDRDMEKDVLAPEPMNRDFVSAQYLAKFGKKPHHRMSDKTIAEKLK